ncbi:hypothetical protein TNCV_318201 [Trichonephila clavipes]|nr:hypothetical protein TNCV_318201 [Trichonephila clavipes]
MRQRYLGYCQGQQQKKWVQIQQPVVASEEPPALQCGTPSRHHLELQDRRDYTPADRAARTCWLKAVPGSCTIWRPETQNSAFSCTLYMAASSKTPTSLVQRSQNAKSRSKCQFFREQSRCVIIPKVKKHQTQLHSTQSWSAYRTSLAEK